MILEALLVIAHPLKYTHSDCGGKHNFRTITDASNPPEGVSVVSSQQDIMSTYFRYWSIVMTRLVWSTSGWRHFRSVSR